MTHSAAQPRASHAHVPWTPEEESTYLALAEHCQGTETEPPCEVCRTPEPGECEEGARLRRAVSRATFRRAQQGS